MPSTIKSRSTPYSFFAVTSLRVAPLRFHSPDSAMFYPRDRTLGVCFQVGSRTGAAPFGSVSSSRLVKRSVRISRTTLTLSTSSESLWDLSNWQRFQSLSESYSTCSCRISLHLQIYLPSQVLQINGRLYHPVPASQCCQKIVNSMVPLLPGRYSGSSLIRTLPPPSRLSVHFPLFTVIEPTLLGCTPHIT